MNDLGYGQLSNPNRSLKLALMRVGNHRELFSNIFTTLVKDFVASHSLSQSPQILRVDDPILITQSTSWTSCRIQYMIFRYPMARDS